MAAEQIIPDPTNGSWPEQRPNAGFDAAKQPHRGDQEKRSHKRKKRGRRKETVSQQPDNNRPAGAEGLIVSGDDIVWSRTQDGPAQRTPRILGEKAFAAVETPSASNRAIEAPPMPPPFKAFEAVPASEPAQDEKPLRPAAVAAFERMTGHDTNEGQSLPAAVRAAGSKAAEAAMASEARPQTETVSRLDRREVLKLAKDIKINGVSVKEIFDANRIDENGLRAVVEAYLHGGDVRQQLSQEIAAKERSYELDPRIRHDRRLGEKTASTASAAKSGNSLFEQAKGAAGQIGSKVLGLTQKSGRKAAAATSKAVSKGAASAQRNVIDNSTIVDWISITAVVIVYSIILILLLR